MTRIVFLGTPTAAVPTLQSLNHHFEVGLVVTQPDRPRGRSGSPTATPVKSAGIDMAIEVAEPASGSELIRAIRERGPFDVGVVVAYGRILTEEVLESTSRGFVNVHFSLLPRWRGAAPVERAIMAGDPMTGITLIALDKGLDTGPVLTAQAVDIGTTESGGSLTARLSKIGARLISESLGGYMSGSIVPVAQTEDGATYAKKIGKEDRPLSPLDSVARAINQIRALAPVPSATLVVDGEVFKVLSAVPHDTSPIQGTWSIENGKLVVGLGDGGLELTLIQPPGRNPQPAGDWLRGARRETGSVS